MNSNYQVFALVIEIYSKRKYDSFKAHACVNAYRKQIVFGDTCR